MLSDPCVLLLLSLVPSGCLNCWPIFFFCHLRDPNSSDSCLSCLSLHRPHPSTLTHREPIGVCSFLFLSSPAADRGPRRPRYQMYLATSISIFILNFPTTCCFGTNEGDTNEPSGTTDTTTLWLSLNWIPTQPEPPTWVRNTCDASVFHL